MSSAVVEVPLHSLLSLARNKELLRYSYSSATAKDIDDARREMVATKKRILLMAVG